MVLSGDKLKFYGSDFEAEDSDANPEGQYVISRKEGFPERNDRDQSFVLLLHDYKVRSKQR